MKFAVVVFPGSNSDVDAYYAASRVLGSEAAAGLAQGHRPRRRGRGHSPRGLCSRRLPAHGGHRALFANHGAVRAFADRGGPVLGICNGFQVLLEAGMLPGAMVRNREIKFVSTHVSVRVEQIDTPFTAACPPGRCCGCRLRMARAITSRSPTCSASSRPVARWSSATWTPPASRPTPAIRMARPTISPASATRARNVVGLMPHPERACEAALGSDDGKVVLASVAQRFDTDRPAWLRMPRGSRRMVGLALFAGAGDPDRHGAGDLCGAEPVGENVRIARRRRPRLGRRARSAHRFLVLPIILIRMTVIDAAVLERHGIKPDEYDRIRELMGREPNLLELGLFSVMWSEHCSYKSSRVHLKTLPTTGPRVVQGPGENAGAVDIGDGLCAVFKIESHNHPSFIEPYQGAATGVGGIIRDIFTMGARPIALLNALRFGSLDTPLARRIFEGVVAGIGGYGNSIGIPTVGGEIVVRRDVRRQSPGQRALPRHRAARGHHQGCGQAARATPCTTSARRRARRHPRRDDGVGRVRRVVGREAAGGAGGRSLHGKAPAWKRASR